MPTPAGWERGSVLVEGERILNEIWEFLPSRWRLRLLGGGSWQLRGCL